MDKKNHGDELLQLLKRVQSGQSRFQPEGSSESDTTHFQQIARTLEFAEREGYITELIAHASSRTGSRVILDVIIIGGLTFEGERFIETGTEGLNSAEYVEEDVIELKPNFFGLGINLRALYRRLTRSK